MEQLSSGLVGLLLGAVLGLALSVFFEDALKRAIARSAKTVRRALARPPAPEQHGEFSLGPLRTGVVIVEGDGSQVIDEQAVDVIVDPDPVSLPDDVVQLRSEIFDRQEALTAAGLPAHWNGPTYAVAGLSIRRIGLDESPGVHLRLKSTDYFTFLATQQLDRELPDGATLRSKYVDPFAPTAVPEFMRASFGTYTVVVSADEPTRRCPAPSIHTDVPRPVFTTSPDEVCGKSSACTEPTTASNSWPSTSTAGRTSGDACSSRSCTNSPVRSWPGGGRGASRTSGSTTRPSSSVSRSRPS